jgi:Domain of unknown function (DUF1893)
MTLLPGVPPLPPGATMAIWPLAGPGAVGAAGAPIYRSDGKWLHPLFELLELLSREDSAADPGDAVARTALASAGGLFLRDRVIGRAAAFLILRSGIRHAYADLVSDGAVAVFEAAGGQLAWGERVAAIGCQTESLLRDVADPNVAWPLLEARLAAARAQ